MDFLSVSLIWFSWNPFCRSTHRHTRTFYVFRWINQPARIFISIFSVFLPLLWYRCIFSLHVQQKEFQLNYFSHLPIYTTKTYALKHILEASWTKTEIRSERMKESRWMREISLQIYIKNQRIQNLIHSAARIHFALLDTCEHSHQMPFQSTLHLNCTLLTWEMVIKYDRINVMPNAALRTEHHLLRTDRIKSKNDRTTKIFRVKLYFLMNFLPACFLFLQTKNSIQSQGSVLWSRVDCWSSTWIERAHLSTGLRIYLI